MTSTGSQKGLILWSSGLCKSNDFRENSEPHLPFARAHSVLGNAPVRNPCVSICCPHIPGKGQPRERSWSQTFEGMGPMQGELASRLKGKWTKDERGGKGRDGNGWVPGADPENRRGKVMRVPGSRKTYKCDPESWKPLGMTGRIVITVANLELFLFSMFYIISLVSVIISSQMRFSKLSKEFSWMTRKS